MAMPRMHPFFLALLELWPALVAPVSAVAVPGVADAAVEDFGGSVVWKCSPLVVLVFLLVRVRPCQVRRHRMVAVSTSYRRHLLEVSMVSVVVDPEVIVAGEHEVV